MDVDALYHIVRGSTVSILKLTVCALILQVGQGTILIVAYSCNIQATETIDIQKDPEAMSIEDWAVA